MGCQALRYKNFAFAKTDENHWLFDWISGLWITLRTVRMQVSLPRRTRFRAWQPPPPPLPDPGHSGSWPRDHDTATVWPPVNQVETLMPENRGRLRFYALVRWFLGYRVNRRSQLVTDPVFEVDLPGVTGHFPASPMSPDTNLAGASQTAGCRSGSSGNRGETVSLHTKPGIGQSE